jgi:hypothetical protein
MATRMTTEMDDDDDKFGTHTKMNVEPWSGFSHRGACGCGGMQYPTALLRVPRTLNRVAFDVVHGYDRWRLFEGAAPGRRAS